MTGQSETIADLSDKLARKTAECDVWRVEAEDLKALDAHAQWVRLDKALDIEADKLAAAEDAIAALREALKLALEYWAHRQQRYKNRHPVWVEAARAALAKTTA